MDNFLELTWKSQHAFRGAWNPLGPLSAPVIQTLLIYLCYRKSCIIKVLVSFEKISHQYVMLSWEKSTLDLWHLVHFSFFSSLLSKLHANCCVPLRLQDLFWGREFNYWIVHPCGVNSLVKRWNTFFNFFELLKLKLLIVIIKNGK